MPLSQPRRRFLHSMLAASAAPLFLPRSAFGANNRIQLASIGVGRMGRGNLSEALNMGMNLDARVVAVCDWDGNRVLSAQKEVDDFYAKNNQAGGACQGYADYRELLARTDIDGVVISTPDHWHALCVYHALKAGKDVYVEKPMTYTIPEGRLLVKTVRETKRVLQVGSQQRSDMYQRRVCQAVRNGRIGKLKEIVLSTLKDSGRGDPTPRPVPKNLNYEGWLGPAPDAPYTEHRVHPQSGFGRPGWLQIESYCLGMVTGWGAHQFDCAQWGNGDEHMITELEAKGAFPDRGLFNVHTDFTGVATYANGVILRSTAGQPVVKFIGEDGWLLYQRGRFEASDRALLREFPDDKIKLVESKRHMGNFIECMRDRKDPVAPVEVGHAANTLCVLNHIAMKTGRKLKWDAAKEQFVNDDGANQMLARPGRAPYTLG